MPSEKSNRVRVNHGAYGCLMLEGGPLTDIEQEPINGTTKRIKRGQLSTPDKICKKEKSSQYCHGQ